MSFLQMRRLQPNFHFQRFHFREARFLSLHFLEERSVRAAQTKVSGRALAAMQTIRGDDPTAVPAAQTEM
jgi:hypothetical protein